MHPASRCRFDRAGAHRDACAGADEIHAGAGLDFAGLDEIVDGLRRGHYQIGRRALPSPCPATPPRTGSSP